jgi:hypothetical protein
MVHGTGLGEGGKGQRWTSERTSSLRLAEASEGNTVS